MARGTIRITGLRELEKSLEKLSRATGKSVMRKVLKEAGEPMAAAARAKAPVLTGNLREAVDVSTKLARSQRTGGAKMTGSGWKSSRKSTVEMYVGPGQQPQAITQEFGTFKEPAQPFMRPAWDSTRGETLRIITHRLGVVIDQAAARAASQAAKAK